jgi:hypothetical protein
LASRRLQWFRRAEVGTISSCYASYSIINDLRLEKQSKVRIANHGTQSETGWWTLLRVAEWVHTIDTTAGVGDIRMALASRCALGRIRANGRRWLYPFNAVLLLDHHDPFFVGFAEQHGRLDPWFAEISAEEWRDLVFFARPTLVVGEQYHVALERALDHSDSPVELRSISKHRLAWADVEFWRDDVIWELCHLSVAAERSAAPREPVAATTLRMLAPPISDRELATWYEQHVEARVACGRTSSGEEDWEAAKQRFPGRVTRARIREIRDREAPPDWKKQGRRAANSPQ